MPRVFDPRVRGDMAVEAVCSVILNGGLPALSVRAVAGEIGMSASSLMYQFTDRARLLRVVALKVGHARLNFIGHAARYDGLLAFIPDREEQVINARVWLAFVELGRSDAGLGPSIASLRRQERELLEYLVDDELDGAGLDALGGVVDGLVAAMFAPEDPLPTDRAKAALAGYLRAVGLPAPEGPLTSAS
jgi:AcrR family transcriptional regulator